MEDLTALTMVRMMAELSLDEIGHDEMTLEALSTVDELIEQVKGLNNGPEEAWSKYLYDQLTEMGLHVLVCVGTETVRDWLRSYEEDGDRSDGKVASMTDDQAAAIMGDASEEWPGDFAWDSLQDEVWNAAKVILEL